MDLVNHKNIITIINLLFRKSNSLYLFLLILLMQKPCSLDMRLIVISKADFRLL